MIIKKVMLSSVEDINEFVKLSSDQPFGVTLKAGKCLIDAKSMMGVLSLDTSETFELLLDADNADAFLESIKHFIL